MSPEGEKLWVPGWDYENVMGTTELWEDHVFVTRSHDHAETDAVFVVKTYRPHDHLVEFYRMEPGQELGLVRVRCSSPSAARTTVEVTYRCTALSADGERFVASFDEDANAEFIGEWKRLLSQYFCIVQIGAEPPSRTATGARAAGTAPCCGPRASALASGVTGRAGGGT